MFQICLQSGEALLEKFIFIVLEIRVSAERLQVIENGSQSHGKALKVYHHRFLISLRTKEQEVTGSRSF